MSFHSLSIIFNSHHHHPVLTDLKNEFATTNMPILARGRKTEYNNTTLCLQGAVASSNFGFLALPPQW